MNKVRVMLVDDSTNLRHVIKRYLVAGLKIEVEYFEAGNGVEAMVTLQEQNAIGDPIDIIFLDWMMPEMTGFEFLQQIRDMEPFKEKPSIIMLTAETYSDQMNAVLKYHVSAYVTKPFTQYDICLAVDKIINSREELKHAV
jgi:two-component system chemotaxis response regulator CheY